MTNGQTPAPAPTPAQVQLRSTTEVLITAQMGRIGLVRVIATELADKEAVSEWPLSTIDVKADLLQSNWDKIESVHEKIMAVKLPDLLSLPYFTERVFDTALLQCAAARAALVALMAKRSSAHEASFRGGARLSIAQGFVARSRKSICRSSREIIRRGNISATCSNR